ncbi:response regulator [Halorussus sp. MSC15.2]|uniref:response regulator n=1 Tax=Halorussus sp. MSC15.2 TaxID=2283638 RepID=UPI0013D310A2|nr:response regulator [Halorussus sp. MSC15.2]NEU56125.1 response regulator [Halorussus sp. MSC15.2]
MAPELLIVDDSDFQRTMVRQAVQDDFDVVGEAGDGNEAVELFEQHSPDVVTMDIMMPEMDGVAATERIKSSDNPPVVVMVTSVDQQEKMKEAVKAGADGYVTKPFEPEDVLSEIASVL